MYSRDFLLEIIEISLKHKLMIFADAFYDKVLYDGAVHTSIDTLADDVLVVTFNGLSKAYRVCGFRGGWMFLTGFKQQAQGYIAGFDMLASMRFCANVPMQHAIPTALGGYQSIIELILPGGRLLEQRDRAWELINLIRGFLACSQRRDVPVPAN